MPPTALVRRFASISLLAVAATLFFCQHVSKPTSQHATATDATFVEQLDQLPLRFEPNRGQTDTTIDYLARGRGYTLFVQATGFALRLNGLEQPVTVNIAGGDRSAGAQSAERLTGTTNYFRGSDSSRWLRAIPGFGRVTYARVLPAIDVTYYGQQGELEYDFIVTPGGNPDRITLEFGGVDNLAIDDNGDLIATVGAQHIRLLKPMAYQEARGESIEIDSRYNIMDDNRVAFELAEYDVAQVLIIDPILRYATFFGGNGVDACRDIAVDAAGFAYITGQTTSSNLHVSSGAFDEVGGVFADPNDVFVAKIDSSGSALVYGTYLSGDNTDIGYSIAVDGDGCAYVTGTTDSVDDTLTVPDEGFPTKNALQPRNAGDFDLFVTKLNADGTDLVYSTYLGGNDLDRGDSEQEQPAIAVDFFGCAYVAGTTQSMNFPTTTGAFSNVAPGPFVVKYNEDGSAFEYATFLKGPATVFVWDVAVNSLGEAYVVGFTGFAGLPTDPVASYQNVKANVEDGFVYRMTAAGDTIRYCTYLGASGDDFLYACAVDLDDALYVTGNSLSNDYPATGFVPPSGGAMVTKFTVAGDTLAYSFFTGGDIGWSIAVDALRRATVAGEAAGSPPDRDVFVAQVNVAGTFTEFETFYAGSFRDLAFGVDVNAAGDAFVVGQTSSSTFPGEPVSNPSPLQGTISVVPDGFVLRLTRDVPVGIDGDVPLTGLVLEQNYPNPFNPTTVISWTQPTAAPVTLRVYDVTGRVIKTLVSETRGAGPNLVEWDGRNDRGHPVASGTYFYRLSTGGTRITKSMVLLK